jgi:lipid-A-disaccharide synthase-like uncharacterized protein
MSFWIIIGLVGQAMFFLRFLIQWIVSERKKQSVIPIQFWFLSIAGSLILLLYAMHRKDPVFIIGQSTGSLIYIRNLILIYRKERAIPNGAQ